MSTAPFSRRALLVGGALTSAGGLLAACSSGSTSPSTTTTLPARFQSRHKGVPLKRARWVIEENTKPGSTDWVIGAYPPTNGLAGYASVTSAQVGQPVSLMVSCSDASFQVEVWRMGYYQGRGGHLVTKSPSLPGRVQTAQSFTATTGTVVCEWEPSWQLDTKGFAPGFYLLKLVSSSGWAQWVPLCVRDDAMESTYVIMSSVTTYQAYNIWGGFSLYGNEDGLRSERARVVSFDRPIAAAYGAGAGDFVGNEFPVLYDMERLGLDLGYWTSIDLHLRGRTLSEHGALFSLGHDEYWSREMRDHADRALSHGTNLAFLGANAIYRKIRLEPIGDAPARLEVNYKDDTDPAGLINPKDGTSNWGSPPVNEPESLLTGSTYVSIGADDDLVIADPAGWWWQGTGVTEGEHLPAVVQGEYNRFIPGQPGPQNVQLFGHSPITKQGSFSDITYLTRAGGGGVLSLGMASFVSLLSDSPLIPAGALAPGDPLITPILLRAMLNLYGLYGSGPASKSMPSQPNWQQYYTSQVP